MEKEEKPKMDIDEKIKNRNNVLKIILLSAFSILIAYKLALSDLSFDFSKFDFSDLLSLILALFSIGLAVTFYFKATDTSNLFYDNTYKFTKEISEILGRIEAGFGEKLRHLDEGYTGLVDKFDGKSLKSKTEDVEKVKKELDSEKEKLEKEVQEKNAILSQLMSKAKLSEKEKQEFTYKINEKDNEINNLSTELNMMKRRLIKSEQIKESEILNSIPPHLRDMLTQYIKMECDLVEVAKAPNEYLIEKLKNHRIEHITGPREARELQKFGVLNELRQFTPMGVELLRSLAKRYL